MAVDCILGDIANVPEDIRQAVINNGGGHKNHTMFWEVSDKPDTSKLEGPLKEAIDADLGGYDALLKASPLQQQHASALVGMACGKQRW